MRHRERLHEKELQRAATALRAPAPTEAASGTAAGHDLRVPADTDIGAGMVIDHVLRLLLERASVLADDSARARLRDGGGESAARRDAQRLAQLLAVCRVIREQLNDRAVLERHAALLVRLLKQGVALFGNHWGPVYMKTIREKIRVAQDTVDEYLAGSIDDVALARAFATLDQGINKLGGDPKELFQRIVATLFNDPEWRGVVARELLTVPEHPPDVEAGAGGEDRGPR